MAGGRRPTNYYGNTRHSGTERPHDPSTPPHSALSTALLPPWIPSIWQPDPLGDTSPRETSEASTSLAAALDTAVKEAVAKAIDGGREDLEKRVQELEERVEKQESEKVQMKQEWEGMLKRVEEVERRMGILEEVCGEVGELRREVGVLGGLRGRIRKVEGKVEGLGEVVVLNGGVEERLRAGLERVEEEMEGLSKRVTDGEGKMAGLKKLVENNLRVVGGAEGVVKQQVGLITKHVCVAMRQYTARKISENNAMIDRTLRERVSEWGDGGFEDDEAKVSELSSSSSSA